jgi:hypothetical protein
MNSAPELLRILIVVHHDLPLALCDFVASDQEGVQADAPNRLFVAFAIEGPIPVAATHLEAATFHVLEHHTGCRIGKSVGKRQPLGPLYREKKEGYTEKKYDCPIGNVGPYDRLISHTNFE